ncbi:S8 family peptidase [Sediminitomix flava]|uniref:Subtilase family protein n=1 Tax=Sediminitomix flava TaxID=379075 RepID=A0A315Z5L5_SEDFL|nr:S8 family peptidase [Sediminitomix flava]PWJ39193.1 subtilase family protein [Sediminitomix flava]
MMKFFLRTLTVISLVIIGFSCSQQEELKQTTNTNLSDYIINLSSDFEGDLTGLSNVLGLDESAITANYDLLNTVVVKLTEEQADRLAGHQLVDAISLDEKVEFDFSQTINTANVSSVNSGFPCELPDFYADEYIGPGMKNKAWILSTGINDHKDLNVNRALEANFIGGSNYDIYGHGTAIAGIVAGKIYGIAKGAEVVSVKVLTDAGSGSTSGIIDALNYTVGQIINTGTADVIVLPIGGGKNSALNSAVNAVSAAGIRVVVPAGNSNSNACNFSPASAEGDNVYTVGAVDYSNTLAPYSNWGICIDLVAPGGPYTTLSNTSTNGYSTAYGTSYASAYVGGLFLHTLPGDTLPTSDDYNKRGTPTVAPSIVQCK